VTRVSSLQTTSDTHAQLIERIAQSRYFAKSARLRDLLEYLCDRVLNEGAAEIHEQEVGHAVFGRPKDYETALDNIVRVHASTLRKRLEQYFIEEGRGETLTIELPKGNYAPVFRERTASVITPAEIAVAPIVLEKPVPEEPVIAAPSPEQKPWITILAAAAALFASTTLVLLWQRSGGNAAVQTPSTSLPASVRAFWSAVFIPNQKTDIVLDDAALALYQELDGRPIALSEYFDRSYQRRLVDKSSLNSIALKRQSSYASVSLLYQLSRTAAALNSDWAPHFARDYAFRELKNDRAILLGNSRSNPWIEPFDNRVGIHWQYDSGSGIYYPVDAQPYKPAGDHPDGYCSIALLPNLGGTGSVVVLSGTGGAATAAAGAFLTDAESMSQLKAKLPAAANGQFPNFEALLRVPSRSRRPKDVEIVIARPVK
jgi:hypothetical protein